MRKQTEQEIKKAFGFVPDFYGAIPDAAMDHLWGIHRDFELPTTALDNKTKELIGLAVAAELKCRYCIYFHTQAARAFGASEQELREALAMAGTTSLFSDSITGMQVDFDKFKRDVDKCIDFMKSNAAVEKPQAPPPTH